MVHKASTAVRQGSALRHSSHSASLKARESLYRASLKTSEGLLRLRTHVVDRMERAGLVQPGHFDLSAGQKAFLASRELIKQSVDPISLEPTDAERAAYAQQNARLASLHPALARVLADPDAYFKELCGRFDAQKARTPEDPYSFDFSDYGLHVLEDLERFLGDEVVKVQGQLAVLEGTNCKPSAISERRAGIEYLNELKAFVRQHLDQGQVTYKELVVLGHFASRALGHFDLAELTPWERFLLPQDWFLQGFKRTSVSRDRDDFEAGRFQVFQCTPPWISGFDRQGGFSVQETFEQGAFNKDKLEMVILPTTESMGAAPFIRFAPYNVFFTGITPEPARADGFNRPGGDFWLHDLRHASAIFAKRKAYQETHGLSDEQMAKLAKMQDRWKVDLDAARAQVPDRSLRWAIGMYLFNTHHDRGVMMVPSSYEAPGNASYVAKLLWTYLKISGQPVGFDHPNATLNKAHDFVRAFMLERVNEERALWASAPTRG